jgi:threonine/homoserine/homoserine lactone efflux protein
MINFLKGFIIGIIMAIPAGPLAILVVKRSLTKGHKEGLATALGVAIADGLYSLVAALGLTAVSVFVLGKKEYFFMGGGILLILIGIGSLIKPPLVTTEAPQERNFFATLLQTMVITLTNPMTILMFIAAFTAAGFEGHEESLTQSVLICLGVFLGSMTWFAIISITSASLRRKVTPYLLNLINTISGSLLIIFGIIFLLDAAWELLVKVY